MDNNNQAEKYERNTQIISYRISEDEKEKKNIYKINDIFSTAIIQLLMTGLYSGGYYIIGALDETVGFGNEVVAPLLYLAAYIFYLAGIVVICNKMIGKERRGYKSGTLAAFFEIHLLFNAAYFLVLGILNTETIMYSLSVLTLTLYFGFSVSLTDLFEARKRSDFWYCFIRSYCDAGITKRDILYVVVIDGTALLASVFFYSREILLLAIAIFLILFLLVHDKRKKHQQKLFSKRVADKISKFQYVLIWNVGTGKSLFELLTKELGQSNSYGALKGNNITYDCVIIINDQPKGKGYPQYLTELRQIIKPNGRVVDAAIVRGEKLKCKTGFSWLRIPNPEPVLLELEEYESIFES